jgi:hypothetical protein
MNEIIRFENDKSMNCLWNCFWNVCMDNHMIDSKKSPIYQFLDILFVITNLSGFISLYKFCMKSNFHMFVQKSYEYHVMVNMNDMYIYSIFKIFKQTKHCFLIKYMNVDV